MDKFCCVCGILASKRCSKCKSVSYCSADHQKSDWKQHKTICQSASAAIAATEVSSTSNQTNGEDNEKFGFGVSKNESTGPEVILKLQELFNASAFRIELLEDGVDHGGAFMIANRDLKPGDLIFQERPGVLCPLLRYGTNNESLNTCWGCFIPLWGGKSSVYRCTKCGLSLCSTVCENALIHKENECRIIKQMKAKLKRRGMNDMAVLKQYMDVCVLRLLIYKDREPKIWEQFRSLDSSSRSLVYQSCSYCGDDVVGEGGKDLRFSMMYTENNSELVLAACHLLSTFWGVACYGGPMLRALYFYLPFVQHDCVGNTFTIHEYETQMLKLRAAVPIKRGEVLTYDFAGIPWTSTMFRKGVLLQKNIICTCHRCSDPTEFGTYCSSFRCTKCDKGYYTPIDSDPLLTGLEESLYKVLLWKCNQSECGDMIPYETIDAYVDSAVRNYTWMKEDASNGSASLGETALKFYNDLWVNYKKLGPSHFLTLEVMDDYLQEDRILNQRTNYLSITSDANYTEDDLVNIRRKRDFAHRLLTHLNAVKKDCINPKKSILFVEYGYYSVITTALDYKGGRADKPEVVKAVQSAVDLWGKAREMFKFLPGKYDSKQPDYNELVNALYFRFRAVCQEEELVLPFLLTELGISCSESEDQNRKLKEKNE